MTAAALDRLASRLPGDRVRGGVLAVQRSGSPATVVAFGTVVTSEGRREARPGDHFLLTSITKSLTALQVLTLASAGLVDLGTPLVAYVPELAGDGREAITARHVLTHTSGLDAAATSAEGPLAARLTEAEHLQIALGARLAFAPGTQFAYSSVGWWILAEVVARVSGMPYPEHLARAVLKPLGVSAATGYDVGGALDASYAREDRAARGEPSHHEAVRAIAYPAGGVVGTAADLVVLGRALLDAHAGMVRGPLRPALVRAVAASPVAGRWRGDDVRWGLGFELGGPGDLRSAATLHAAGGSGTALWADPERDVVVVLLTTSWDVDRVAAGELLDGVYGAIGA